MKPGAMEYTLAASSLDDYIPAIKAALPYSDHIHLLPQADLAWHMPRAMEAALGDVLPRMMDGFFKRSLDEAKRIVASPVVGLEFAEDIKGGLMAKLRDIAQMMLEAEFRRPPFRDLATGEQEAFWARVAQIRPELSPALEAGLLSLPGPDADPEKRLHTAAAAFRQAFLPYMLRSTALRLGGGEMPLPDAAAMTRRLWAVLAAPLVLERAAPLLTISPQVEEMLLDKVDRPPASWRCPPFAAKFEFAGHITANGLGRLELPAPRDRDLTEVLELRAKAGQALAPVRFALARYSERLRRDLWDDELADRAERFLPQKVQPRLDEVIEALAQDKDLAALAGRSSLRLGLKHHWLALPEPLVLLALAGENLAESVTDLYYSEKQAAGLNGLLIRLKAG